MKLLWSEARCALAAVLALGLLLGVAYPLAVWLAGRCLFPGRAGGSILRVNGIEVGSGAIGQRFASDRYFHPRPSAVGYGYDSPASGGSNLGPLSASLLEEVRRRAAAFRRENGMEPDRPVPPDAVTASASGLDPHISLANALCQAQRVAKARGLSGRAVKRLVEALRLPRQLGILGEERVSVLWLNLELDKMR